MIQRLNLYRLSIPFKLVFKHHSAERVETETAWVEAESNGLHAFGEGCPRKYVTGESLETVDAFFRRHCAALRQNVTSVDDLKLWMGVHREDIGKNPAAWCAIELAILELFALQQGMAVERLLSIEPPSSRFRYSAVIGDGPADKFRATVSQYSRTGFSDFKIKLSGDPERDQEKIRILEAQNIPDLRIRADANNLWKDAESATTHLTRLNCSFAGIEEPVTARQFDAMRRVAIETNCRIILDESFLGLKELPLIGKDPERWIINIRVSKMGGLLRSLEVVSGASQWCVPVIVGAQVGESSLLTRVAMTVAQAAGDALLGQEGAFGTHLLETDAADPPLMFGQAGILDAAPLRFAEKAGWGLSWRLPDKARQFMSSSDAFG